MRKKISLLTSLVVFVIATSILSGVVGNARGERVSRRAEGSAMSATVSCNGERQQEWMHRRNSTNDGACIRTRSQS
jgi:hypothetical protein